MTPKPEDFNEEICQWTNNLKRSYNISKSGSSISSQFISRWYLNGIIFHTFFFIHIFHTFFFHTYCYTRLASLRIMKTQLRSPQYHSASVRYCRLEIGRLFSLFILVTYFISCIKCIHSFVMNFIIIIVLWWSEAFEVSLNWILSMMPRDASLAYSCIPDCYTYFFSSGCCIRILL